MAKNTRNSNTKYHIFGTSRGTVQVNTVPITIILTQGYKVARRIRNRRDFTYLPQPTNWSEAVLDTDLLRRDPFLLSGAHSPNESLSGQHKP